MGDVLHLPQRYQHSLDVFRCPYRGLWLIDLIADDYSGAAIQGEAATKAEAEAIAARLSRQHGWKWEGVQ